MAQAEEARDKDVAGLADLERRLELAAETVDGTEPDPAERDRLAEHARLARAAEMDARLALRTLEEQVRALAGRADALRRAAEHERLARLKEIARRERMLREARTAAAVHAGATFLAQHLERSLALAATQRAEAEAFRSDADAALGAARASVRSLTATSSLLVDAAHRDEMARAEQQIGWRHSRNARWLSSVWRLRPCWPNTGPSSWYRCSLGEPMTKQMRMKNLSWCRMCASCSRSGCESPDAS